MEAHHKSNPWTYLEVKRLKFKVTRPINAVRESASSSERETDIIPPDIILPDIIPPDIIPPP